MKIYLSLIFFLIACLSYISNSFAQGNYTIQVEIDTAQNLNGKYVYINFVDYSGINSLEEDSVLIQNNSFEFTGDIQTPGILTNIYTKEKDFNDLYQFLLVPGVNKLSVHKPQFNQLTGKLMKGLSNTESLESENALIYHRNKSLFQIFLPEYIWAINHKKDARKTFSQLSKQIIPFRIEIARMYPNSYASLYLQKYFLFEDLKDRPTLAKELFEGLTDSIKQFPEAKELELKINALLTNIKGAKVKDFIIKDVDSREVKLSDFKGKKVLLEFWASWCGPCISNLPKLKKFAENNPQIKILAISLDDKEEHWKEAIKKHEFDFAKHVSELKGWKGEISDIIFNVNAIPRAILIDEQGNIEDLDFNIKSIE